MLDGLDWSYADRDRPGRGHFKGGSATRGAQTGAGADGDAGVGRMLLRRRDYAGDADEAEQPPTGDAKGAGEPEGE